MMAEDERKALGEEGFDLLPDTVEGVRFCSFVAEEFIVYFSLRCCELWE